MNFRGISANFLIRLSGPAILPLICLQHTMLLSTRLVDMGNRDSGFPRLKSRPRHEETYLELRAESRDQD